MHAAALSHNINQKVEEEKRTVEVNKVMLSVYLIGGGLDERKLQGNIVGLFSDLNDNSFMSLDFRMIKQLVLDK